MPAQRAFPDCESSLKLEGIISIDCCTPRDKCINAAKAIYDYSLAAQVERNVLSISTHASPWHLYDDNMRIITIEELAEVAKAKLRDGRKRIALVSSWTSVAPTPNSKSLAQKLSDALGGVPVNGMDGFVWIAKDGSVRTTHQAFTVHRKCPYAVQPGQEVMVSLAAGWPLHFEEDYVKRQDGEGILLVGAAWDIFMLCPEKALRSYEAAAQLSSPIAAYNAAMMRLEHGQDDDRKAAKKLFKQAAALGDKQAAARLKEMNQSLR